MQLRYECVRVFKIMRRSPIKKSMSSHAEVVSNLSEGRRKVKQIHDLLFDNVLFIGSQSSLLLQRIAYAS